MLCADLVSIHISKLQPPARESSLALESGEYVAHPIPEGNIAARGMQHS